MVYPAEQDIILDNHELSLKKEQNRNRVYIWQIPIRRLIGYILVMFGVFLHKIALLTDVSWQGIFLYYGIVIGYNLITFLILYLFFTRVRIINLGELFLFLDLIILNLAIYVSGDIKSLFFVLLIIRSADHVFVSFKKTVFYNHCSVLSYCLLLLYLVYFEGRDVFWPIEFLKLTIVYFVNWYISVVAKMIDGFKQRLKNTIMTAKNALIKRIRTEDQLQEKNTYLNKLNRELQQSMENVKTLQGLLPICAKCKKVRDEEGYWNQIDAYIEAHSEVQFSHGLCEKCATEMYGDKKWFKKNKLGANTK